MSWKVIFLVSRWCTSLIINFVSLVKHSLSHHSLDRHKHLFLQSFIIFQSLTILTFAVVGMLCAMETLRLSSGFLQLLPREIRNTMASSLPFFFLFAMLTDTHSSSLFSCDISLKVLSSSDGEYDTYQAEAGLGC